MKPIFLLLVVFMSCFIAGQLIAVPTAECRTCNAKQCFHDSGCGPKCACVFPGGNNGRDKGFCAQVGD